MLQGGEGEGEWKELKTISTNNQTPLSGGINLPGTDLPDPARGHQYHSTHPVKEKPKNWRTSVTNETANMRVHRLHA